MRSYLVRADHDGDVDFLDTQREIGEHREDFLGTGPGNNSIEKAISHLCVSDRSLDVVEFLHAQDTLDDPARQRPIAGPEQRDIRIEVQVRGAAAQKIGIGLQAGQKSCGGIPRKSQIHFVPVRSYDRRACGHFGTYVDKGRVGLEDFSMMIDDPEQIAFEKIHVAVGGTAVDDDDMRAFSA